MRLAPIYVSRRHLAATVLAAGFVVLATGTVLSAPSIWRDHATGFAMSGYDPVAYFTHAKPVPGAEGVEYRWGGAVWKFVNSGNRDAFAKHPEAYVPRFAGYDAEALARGRTVQGNPLVWLRYNDRIYLFRDIASRHLWWKNPAELTQSAEVNWRKLGNDLPGTSEWRPTR